MTACYEVYAVRYARHDRDASMNFMDPTDLHEGPEPIDYYVWAIRSDDRTIVVDTGFDAETAATRGRTFLRPPTEGLAAIGIDAAEVEDVIVTHMHYDHVGNFALFPKATFHLQDREMAFATGRPMAHGPFRAPYAVEDIVGMVRQVHAGRVRFHDGDAELAPGISLHHIGGHTDGLQAVSVATARGPLVLASDAAHLFANMDEANPYPIVYHVGDMLEGHRRLRELAGSDGRIIPGHDPRVMDIYPPAKPELEGIVARLDEPPTT